MVEGPDGDVSDETATAINELIARLDAFLAPEPGLVEQTRDFSDHTDDELAERFADRYLAAFPEGQGARSRSSQDGLLIHDYTLNFLSLSVASELHFHFRGHGIEGAERALMNPLDEKVSSQVPSGFPAHVFVLIGNETDSEYQRELDRFRAARSERRWPDIRIVYPTQAWTILFGDDKGPSVPDEPVAQSTDTATAIHMVSDDAIDDPASDRLEFGAYADALFGLIDNPDTKAPLTLAINARWGMGKTSLARLVERRLRTKPEGRNEKSHVTYWFNAWMHDEADKLAAAFMADIVRACHGMQPLWRRLVRPLPTALCSAETMTHRRVWAYGIASAVAVWFTAQLLARGNPVLAANLGLDPIMLKEATIGGGGSLLAVLLVLFSVAQKALETVKSVGAFIAAPGMEANIGSLRQVREQLQRLIRSVTPEGSKFVVFIDDLERCRETRAIDVLEVVNQLLSFDPVVTVVVADMPAVATCAEIKYKDLAEQYDPSKGARTSSEQGRQAYGRLFLQKFIQLQFDLPRVPPERLRQFTNDVVEDSADDGTDIESSDGDWKHRLITQARSAWVAVSDLALSAWRPAIGRQAAFPSWFRRARNWQRAIAILLLWPLFTADWWQRLGLRLRASNYLRRDRWRWGWLFHAFTVVGVTFFFGLWLLFQLGLAHHFLSMTFPSLSVPGAFITAPNLGIPLWMSYELTAFLFFSVIPFLLVPIVWFAGRRQQFVTEALHQKLREELDSRLDRGEVPSALENLPSDFGTLDEEELDALLVERRQRRLAADSDWFSDARTFALMHVAMPPRNMKRLVNRLRLVLFLLDAKELLGEQGSITPQHVGKWVALQEGWPEISAAIRSGNRSIGDLENPDATKLAKFLGENWPGHADDQALATLFDAEPKLEPVMDIFITLVDGRGDGPEGENQTAETASGGE